MPEALESLQQIYQDYFLLGAAVSSKTLCTSEELILKHFGSITAENAMKFGRIHPASDRYDFREADAIVDFARTHGKQIRGHTLVWHNQVPDWVFLDDDGCPVSRESFWSGCSPIFTPSWAVTGATSMPGMW